MNAGCACPYHDAACAGEATAMTARYGPLCGECRSHLAEALRGMGLGEWMLDVRDDGTVAGGREIWRQGRKELN
jgi:hypothetical protein